MNDRLLKEIETIIRSVFQSEDIIVSLSTTAHDIPGWDSLKNIEILTTIEAKYSIRFSMAELILLENIGDLVKNVEVKLK